MNVLKKAPKPTNVTKPPLPLMAQKAPRLAKKPLKKSLPENSVLQLNPLPRMKMRNQYHREMTWKEKFERKMRKEVTTPR